MKFGRMPAGEAAGAILAHSVKASGLSFKKGRVLSADDAAALDRLLSDAGRRALLEKALGSLDMPGLGQVEAFVERVEDPYPLGALESGDCGVHDANGPCANDGNGVVEPDAEATVGVDHAAEGFGESHMS